MIGHIELLRVRSRTCGVRETLICVLGEAYLRILLPAFVRKGESGP